MRKVGLYITTLLHDIVQAQYKVSFNKDFRGMILIDFFKEYEDSFYDHAHCGFPGCKREKLEKDIVDALIRFKTTHMIPDVTEHEDDDLPPAA